MLEQPDAITVRFARPADLEALRRLVDRDGGGAGTRHMLLDLTRQGSPSRVLVAIAADAAVAALHLDSRDAVADPFTDSSEPALQLLRTRAAQLRRTHRADGPGRLASLVAQLRPRPYADSV